METGDGSILLVDDDDLVRTLVDAQLSALGYRVRAVSDVAAALRVLDAGEPFALMVTDVMLAGPVDGYGLARQARERRPGLPVLYASGCASAPRGESTADVPTRHLQKPFRLPQLARAVEDLLAREDAAAG